MKFLLIFAITTLLSTYVFSQPLIKHDFSNGKIVVRDMGLYGQLKGRASLRSKGVTEFELFLIDNHTINTSTALSHARYREMGVLQQELNNLLINEISKTYPSSTALTNYEKNLFFQKKISKNTLFNILVLRFNKTPENQIYQWLQTNT